MIFLCYESEKTVFDGVPLINSFSLFPTVDDQNWIPYIMIALDDTGELSGNVEIALSDFFIHWEPSHPVKVEMEYHMNSLKGQGVQKAKNWNPDTWPPFIMSVTIGKHDKWRPSIES